MSGSSHIPPIMDPSALTTDQLRRELTGLRDLLTVRVDAIEKAQQKFEESITRVPTEVDKQISHLQLLHDEKFSGVSQQFRERDVRADQDKFAASTAINAALSALKEMISLQNSANVATSAKSDAVTSKLIEGIQLQLQVMSKSVDEKIGDIKSRIDRGEGTSVGHTDQSAVTTRNTSMMIAVGGLIVAAVSLFIAFNSHQNNSLYSQPPTVVAPAVIPVNPSH